MPSARRLLQVVAFISTLVVGTASMAVIVTQTTWFKEWLRGFIVRQAEDYVNGRLSIGRLDGNLFFGVELENVSITANGRRVVDIKDVGLNYNAFSFIAGHVVLDAIRLDQPTLLVERTAEGWNLLHLIKARTPDPDEPKNRRPIEIGEIGISDGTLVFANEVAGTSGTIDLPARVERLDASVGVTSDENELKVSIAHVSLRAQEPAFGVNAMSGTIRRRENTLYLDNVAFRSEETSLRVKGSIENIEGGAPVLDLTAASEKFDVDEIGKLVPALRGYLMQPAFEITAKGPADRMAVTADVREQNVGHLTAALTVDSEAPGRRVAGNVVMEHLNIGPLARSATLKSDITGRGTIDLALPEGRLPLSGSYALIASSVDVQGYRATDVNARGRIDDRTVRVNASAAAYGGRATASGTARIGQPLALDLAGRASGLDLRNLPPALDAPGVPSNLQFTYRLQGRGEVFSGDVRMAESTMVGGTIREGTTGTFRFGGGAPSYSATGQVANLDVQQVGRGFGLEALSADKYASRLNATFSMTGSGGGRYPLTLDATGTLSDSEMFGASFPRLDVAANIAGGDMHVKGTGQFARLNPEVITGDQRTRGELSGAIDADARIRDYANGITIDDVDVTGRLNVASSRLAGFAIDTGVIDGSFANREGQVNQLTITGPDLTVQGQGAIALNETGASNLTLHLESPSIERIGALLDQPLRGGAIVDATVTGNATSLAAKGTLKGSNIRYGDNSALALDSTFDAVVPNLTPADATVKATSVATFLEIGGQKINELTATTSYAKQAVEFTAAAKQGLRELDAAGALTIYPDHQEVRVRNMAFRSEMIQWATEPGSEATVHYGTGRIEVQNVRLVNGDQRIAADGVIGSNSESLRVEAQNVDVAQVDALLLGDQRLAGRFTGTAIVSGPTDAPRVAADFTLAPGAFGTSTFESLAGKVEYAARGVTMDVRLQQSPQAWLTAKGTAPITLLGGNLERAGAHVDGAAGDPINIDIATSRIDLGLVQGFTSYVTNVAGTLQANLTVTGRGNDPQVNGVVAIAGGAFAVPELGTAYTGVDTRLEFAGDRLTVSEMRVLDRHGQPLTIGGTIGIHAAQVGAVDVAVKSDTFEVIDNDLGRLKLNTDIRLTGDLRAPRIDGSVDVHTGTIDVAQALIAATGDGAYSTSATELASGEWDGGPPVIGVPSLFDRLHLNVTLAIPSNLVLNGQNIRPANAPIDVGDMSATVGGSVRIEKLPFDVVRLYGDINTVRGSYTFQGRRFDIERDGRIRFFGGNEFEPYLDLRASRTISGIQTFVRIRGTMREPELSFSSNPPLDEADILALIIFNQPVNELGEGQQVSLAQRAGALAGGYLASGLATSIGNALKLDEFQIQAAGDQGGGPQVTVGEQIGDRLFFRLRQGFGGAQATELILEYQIKEYLRLQGTAAEVSGGTQRPSFRRIERGGIDLIFFFNY